VCSTMLIFTAEGPRNIGDRKTRCHNLCASPQAAMLGGIGEGHMTSLAASPPLRQVEQIPSGFKVLDASGQVLDSERGIRL